MGLAYHARPVVASGTLARGMDGAWRGSRPEFRLAAEAAPSADGVDARAARGGGGHQHPGVSDLERGVTRTGAVRSRRPGRHQWLSRSQGWQRTAPARPSRDRRRDLAVRSALAPRPGCWRAMGDNDGVFGSAHLAITRRAQPIRAASSSPESPPGKRWPGSPALYAAEPDGDAGTIAVRGCNECRRQASCRASCRWRARP